jgi:hypothetical protein
MGGELLSTPFHFQFLLFVLVGTIRILIVNAIYVWISGVAFYPEVEWRFVGLAPPSVDK